MSISTAVDASSVARAVGISSQFSNSRGSRFTALAQRLAVVGQGASASTYSAVKAQFTSALAVAAAYGFGSPLHLVAMQLFPANGDGVGRIPVTLYPLADAASSVAASGSITPSGTQTAPASYVVRVGNVTSIPFTIAAGATVAARCASMTAAINAQLNMPVVATDATTRVDIAAKWKGTSANGIFTEVASSSTTGGTSFAVTQLAGGLINPSVQTALDQVGSTWETMIINCMEPGDATALDAISVFGESRWGALVRKPLVSFTADTQAAASSAITIPGARTSDRTNVQLVAPGSRDPRFVVAARQVARIAAMADSNPAHDYGSLPADGITPGTDAQQWLYTDRDVAVKAGCSTIEVKDRVVTIGDVVTMYHPAGDELPAYRYVVDIVKLQNALYNFALEFESAEWNGAPLLPDGQPTLNATAKTPGAAVAAAAAITDILAAQAILSDPKATKALIVAEIDASNPKRVNLRTPLKVSGNTNIISTSVEWSFNFASSV